MKITLTQSTFQREFINSSRKDSFSYEALDILFNYFQEIENNLNEEIELDIINICCDYTEDTWQNIAMAYDINLDQNDSEDDQKMQVNHFLQSLTTVIGETCDGFLYSNF